MLQRSRTSERQPLTYTHPARAFNPRRIVSVRIIPSRRPLHRKRSKAGSLLTSIEELHAIDYLVRCSIRNGAPDESRTHDPKIRSKNKRQFLFYINPKPLNADAFKDKMFFLASHGYRVIADDRRGHGRSSQPWHGNDMRRRKPTSAAVSAAKAKSSDRPSHT